MSDGYHVHTAVITQRGLDIHSAIVEYHAAVGRGPSLSELKIYLEDNEPVLGHVQDLLTLKHLEKDHTIEDGRCIVTLRPTRKSIPEGNYLDDRPKSKFNPNAGKVKQTATEKSVKRRARRAKQRLYA